MTSASRVFRSRQQGVTLIVALIFLAILTLLGITVARTTSLEERMAGNTRDRDIAFQSAESALRDAAADLPGFIDPADPFDGSTAGLLDATGAPHANSQAYWNEYDWAGASQESSVAFDASVGAIPSPRYVVEKRPDSGDLADPIQHFRITARGVGANPNTVVILQAEYEYDAD
jgi:type IV pilus assembly protein PilX